MVNNVNVAVRQTIIVLLLGNFSYLLFLLFLFLELRECAQRHPEETNSQSSEAQEWIIECTSEDNKESKQYIILFHNCRI